MESDNKYIDFSPESYAKTMDDAYESKHSPMCECRECLGADYDRYHHMIANDEYTERTGF